jgi:hypothetical protein
LGGSGGGGNGNGSGFSAFSGSTNLGGGGGGVRHVPAAGKFPAAQSGAGGSGRVIIKWRFQ